MPSADRWRSILQSDLRNLDSAAFSIRYHQFTELAIQDNDRKLQWGLDYLKFKNRGNLNLTQGQAFALLADLERKAIEENWPVEALVARHYLNFALLDAQKIPVDQQFAYLLHEYSQMNELGLEQFQDYDLSDMMYHSGSFMFDLEDYDNALQFFLVGERFWEFRKTRRHTVILTLNHIQSIFQHHKDYSKGIEYAQKIIRITDSIQVNDPGAQEFCRYWRGLATIDIASMLIQQQKFEEGERFADQGYALTKFAGGENEELGLEAEFDALMPLFFIKLELNKITEAEALLQRADKIWAQIGHKEFNYFKQIRLWEAHTRIAERKGDFSTSVLYERRAKPLRDSLDRRTDARKLEKIKQRLEAQKYTEKIKRIEREKQVQARLLYGTLLGLLLVALFAFWNYRRMHNKRRQAMAALQIAQNNLETYIQNFLEESERAEKLRLEITRISAKGVRDQYMQELLQSTILTEKDWVQFRALFEKVYPDFIPEQKTLFPEITQAELRYLVLEKLQLTTQEMARMIGVSSGTIRQTRARLRKKQL